MKSCSYRSGSSIIVDMKYQDELLLVLGLSILETADLLGFLFKNPHRMV